MNEGMKKKTSFFTLQELEKKKRKQEQEKQEKENHDAMQSEVKKFVVYVLGLDPDTLEQSEELKRGMFKLSDAIEKKSFDIIDGDVESFFDAVSFLMDILSSYDKKEEAIKCFQELELESKLTLNFDQIFDQIIDSFLDFYKTKAGVELKKFIGEKNASKMVISVLGNDNENKNKEKQTELFDANTNVINANEDKDEDKVNALQNRYKKLSEFNDKSKYEQLDLFNLNLLLLDMENYMMDAIQGKIAEKNNSGYEQIQGVMKLHRDVSDFFLKAAQSNVNKLLIDGCKSCRLLDTNIENISNKISNLVGGELTNKNEYQAKIKFLEQSINVNIRGGSLSSARIRGLRFVISSGILNELKSVSDEFCYKNDNCLAAILKIKQYRNLFVNEMSKIRNARQKMSVQAIEELKEINKDLDKMCNKQVLKKLEELPKTVNVEHSIKTGFWWWLYKLFNFITKEKQIAPQNSLNTQISTVVHQRFNQFREKDFIVPLNRLIIRSLGIEPDMEQYEINSLFDNTFINVLLPMLNGDLDRQIGSLANALYNVIPQNQKENSFKGVQYAISQYVGDAMIKCWVEAIFDFIRMDSGNNGSHLSRYRHKFDADKYYESLAQDEKRKNQFKKMLSDRFSECRSNIATNIEQEIKNGKNDHEICERLLKRNIELLDFCNKLHERNFGQLSDYIKGCINAMTSKEKDVLSNIQLSLKFSIFNCRFENEDKAPEKSNKDFLNNLLLSSKKAEYEDAVALKKVFLNNLSPSSKTAYEQSETLARESVNDSKLQEKEKQTVVDINLPDAYRGEGVPTKAKNKKNKGIIINQENNM